jgi:hypothetical protein
MQCAGLVFVEFRLLLCAGHRYGMDQRLDSGEFFHLLFDSNADTDTDSNPYAHSNTDAYPNTDANRPVA